MKDFVCVLMSCCIFMAGCAGREANLVQVHQFGDEQKTCGVLRTEMHYIENEISRLLPKSDKTGKNIALGATGIIFIVPLFFMDLKQGEKKEIEAYRQRFNHLLMITQQKDCKLPTAVAEETVERVPSAEEMKKMSKGNVSDFDGAIKCNACGTLGNDNPKWVMQDSKILCIDCDKKMEASKETPESSVARKAQNYSEEDTLGEKEGAKRQEVPKKKSNSSIVY